MAMAVIALPGPAMAEDLASKLLFGMSFSFLGVDTSKVPLCATESRGAPIRGTAFLPHYEDGHTRQEIVKQLSAMRQSGFRGLRTIIFFGAGSTTPADWFDVDRDKVRAARIVRQYVDDVAAAGFDELILQYGMQGTASPSCRRSKWGECFDEQTISRSIAFIASVRTAIGGTPPLPMRFEVGPEQCAPDNLPEPLRSNLNKYVRSTLSAYIARFPNDRTAISCSIKRFAASKAWIDTVYAGFGRKPSSYQIHLYQRPGFDTERELSQIVTKLTDPDIPVVVGETTYGNRQHVRTVIQLLGAARGGLAGVYFWPLANAADQCHVDIAPPYTLDRALGSTPPDP